jgi:hypothetical protein
VDRPIRRSVRHGLERPTDVAGLDAYLRRTSVTADDDARQRGMWAMRSAPSLVVDAAPLGSLLARKQICEAFVEAGPFRGKADDAGDEQTTDDRDKGRGSGRAQ